MALGGGVWQTQNKKLPGTYINFISKVRANVNMGERGYVAMPLELDWGEDGKIFTVTAEDFQKESTKIFGYDFAAPQMQGLRELFENAKVGYFYRLGTGAVKAKNDIAEAKYTGTRGNDITVSINRSVDYDNKYIVTTKLKNGEEFTTVDVQTIKKWDELKDNDFVVFARTGELNAAVTAGKPLTGGKNAENITTGDYQKFLEVIEPVNFNVLACPVDDKSIQNLFIAFTKRCREDVGSKFQVVVHGYENADYEGVISIKNDTVGQGVKACMLVYWVAGAEASCPVNESCTNKIYTGDYEVVTNYKKLELEKAIDDGLLIFHAGEKGLPTILRDINTFTSFSKKKNEDFSSNQVIRVLDQHAMDIATLFNKLYLGKEPNDVDGRMALWGDIVAYEKEMQRIRAIQNFKPEDVPVPEQGQSKEIVLAEYAIQPVMCMEKLYMNIVIA